MGIGKCRILGMDNSELTTKPTLDTILERINAQGDVMRAGFQTIDQRLEKIEIRLDTVELRLDRVHSMVLEVRADVREFRSTFKQPSPSS